MQKIIPVIFLSVAAAVSAQAQTMVTTNISFTGNYQSLVLPSHVVSVNFSLQGADGANFQNGYFVFGGQGGTVTGTLAVSPGATLFFGVGGGGSSILGGWNGGGSDPNANGGGGGGATSLFINSTNWSNLVAIAGGGSGGNSRDGLGGNNADVGGNRGVALVGGDGTGGGGGGYFGGVGGGVGFAAGGGTSWVNSSLVTASSTSAGSPNGSNGYITISYIPEPGSTSLVIAGLGALFAIRRRRAV